MPNGLGLAADFLIADQRLTACRLQYATLQARATAPCTVRLAFPTARHRLWSMSLLGRRATGEVSSVGKSSCCDVSDSEHHPDVTGCRDVLAHPQKMASAAVLVPGNARGRPGEAAAPDALGQEPSFDDLPSSVTNSLASAANAWLKLSKLHVWDDECIGRGIKCTLYKVIVQSTLL